MLNPSPQLAAPWREKNLMADDCASSVSPGGTWLSRGLTSTEVSDKILFIGW